MLFPIFQVLQIISLAVSDEVALSLTQNICGYKWVEIRPSSHIYAHYILIVPFDLIFLYLLKKRIIMKRKRKKCNRTHK